MIPDGLQDPDAFGIQSALRNPQSFSDIPRIRAREHSQSALLFTMASHFKSGNADSRSQSFRRRATIVLDFSATHPHFHQRDTVHHHERGFDGSNCVNAIHSGDLKMRGREHRPDYRAGYRKVKNG